MLRRIAFLSCAGIWLTLLPGCLMDDPNPSPSPNAKQLLPPTLNGTILLQDNQGIQPSAQFAAYFTHEAPSSRGLVPRYRGLERLSRRRDYSGTDCALMSGEASRAAQATYISVGTLHLRHLLSDVEVDITDDGSHRYRLPLDPGLPSDTYAVQADGAGDVPKFAEFLKVPPVPVGVSVNGSPLLSAGLKISESTDLSLDWPADVIPDDNHMVIQILGLKGGAEVVFQCEVPESSLSVAQDRVLWPIPKEQMSQMSGFPAPSTGLLQIMRVSLQGDAKAPRNVKLLSVRSVTTQVSVQP